MFLSFLSEYRCFSVCFYLHPVYFLDLYQRFSFHPIKRLYPELFLYKEGMFLHYPSYSHPLFMEKIYMQLSLADTYCYFEPLVENSLLVIFHLLYHLPCYIRELSPDPRKHRYLLFILPKYGVLLNFPRMSHPL